MSARPDSSSRSQFWHACAAAPSQSFAVALCVTVWIVAALTLAPTATAQAPATLTGRIIDSDGAPLPGVNVRLATLTIGDASRVDGSFRFSAPPGEHVVIVSAVGFATIERSVILSAGGEVVADFVLEEAVIDAAEVVVIASKRAQIATQVPASVAVVPAEFLETRNHVSLDEALRHVSGVQLQDNQINLRGTSGFTYNTGSRVMLLLDGVPLLTPDTEGLPYDAFPVSQVKQVEVLKGPGSALYGSGAMGGVINVVSKPVPDRAVTEIRAFGGFYQRFRHESWRDRWPGSENVRPLYGVTASHARPLGKSAGMWFSLSARTDRGYRNLAATKLVVAYTKWTWAFGPRTQMAVLGGLLVRERDNFLFWNGQDDPLNPGQFALASPDTPTGSNDAFSNQFSFLPSLTRFTSDRSYLTFRARLFGTVVRPIDDISGSVKSISEGTLGFRFGGEVQYNRSIGADQHLTLGVSGDANATRSSFFQTQDGDEFGSQPEGAVYLQYESPLTDKIAVVIGSRFDAFRIDAGTTTTRLSPKVSSSYVVSPVLTFRAAFGLGFRVPSLAERFTEDDSFLPIRRNPTLKPEKSTSFEVGARGLVVADRGGAEWDIAAFWYDLHDLIEPRFVRQQIDGSTTLGFQFLNITRGRIRGFEGTLRAATPGERFAVRLGYTFLETEDLDLKEPLPFRPQHLLVFSSDVRVTKRINASVDFRYADEAEFVDSDFARFVPDATVLVPVRVVDLRVGYRWRSLVVGAIVRNLFDYYYLERPALLGPPRQYLFQVSGTF